MYSNMKYYENICNCLRVIQQDINRKLKSANCWQRTSLNTYTLNGVQTLVDFLCNRACLSLSTTWSEAPLNKFLHDQTQFFSGL